MGSEELWMELQVLHQHARPPLQDQPANGGPAARGRTPARVPGPGAVVPAHRGPAGAGRAAPGCLPDAAHHRPCTASCANGYGYRGSYWTFLRQVRPLRPELPRELEVRF
jgi:hypothetical protein